MHRCVRDERSRYGSGHYPVKGWANDFCRPVQRDLCRTCNPSFYYTDSLYIYAVNEYSLNIALKFILTNSATNHLLCCYAEIFLTNFETTKTEQRGVCVLRFLINSGISHFSDLPIVTAFLRFLYLDSYLVAELQLCSYIRVYSFGFSLPSSRPPPCHLIRTKLQVSSVGGGRRAHCAKTGSERGNAIPSSRSQHKSSRKRTK
ncbi:hypothetical protein J2Z66_003130 [Paenibacillus eucommiae]|uniref:Uncharacterized protein n=1 Tax=Paenibacillus eucommiae TaxID=1355755 RepID=A0ABS4IVA8_9BACL|nr:hypothetical protein [Paenibacillus eucommiae]